MAPQGQNKANQIKQSSESEKVKGEKARKEKKKEF